MKCWYSMRARAGGAEISIYDEIGAYGVSAKGFLAELGALPEDAPIDLRLNSPGGSVFDAVAIHNALKRHEGTVTVWIDGIAASAASYVAMAGDEIVMPENAFLMIHYPSGLVMGTAADMRDMAGTLDKIAGSMTRGYAARSGKPEEDIAALMAAETWFDAQDALDLGLATRLAEPVRMAARFDVGQFRNTPPALVSAVLAYASSAALGSPGSEEKTVGDADEDAAPDGGAAAADLGDGVPGQADAPAGAVSDGAAAPGVGAASAPGAPSPEPDPLPAPGRPVAATDTAAIRAATMAHARTVVDLCRLAGQPQMAGRFLEQEVSVDEVRAALLAARAEAEPEIVAHHPQPGGSATTRPWGDVIARTFKPKG